MTISGAAASPNMGYHSSLPLAFLMTLAGGTLALVSVGLTVAHEALKRENVSRGSIILVSDLEILPDEVARVSRVIGELRAGGATVIVATHLLERGRALCDRALVLEEGRLVWSGPASEVPEDAVAGGPAS